MTRHVPLEKAPARVMPCLTEMSVKGLIAGALGISALFWLAILSVI